MRTPHDCTEVVFDAALTQRLREAYAVAIECGADLICLDDLTFDTSYAGYVLEYLDTLFPPQTKH